MMKRTLFGLSFLLISFLGVAQSSFDHMAIVVKDLEASKTFYNQVLGFKNIEDPTGNPLIDWVENNSGQQIHMVQGDISQIKLNKSVHFSFAVEAFTIFVQGLREKNIAFENWEGESGKITIRQDGIRQIYLQDPNGYWIELNDRRK